VNGRLIEVHSPFADCAPDAQATACRALFARLKNPSYSRDEVALPQTTGWIDAWLAAPSAYAVAARSAKDVAAAVDFARAHNVRIVVKGGGHSYQGTSNAPDSLLVWTRDMDDVVLHDAFVPVRCERSHAPVPAVSVGAGAIWMHVYQAVSGQANRYVQGGGCATVGVAGLVQSGRFGSFSKKYGTAAGALLEAEIVTADGAIRVVNACSDADLFWAIRGGGGGTFGVVTRLTLRTRELPSYFGGAFAAIRASSDASFRELVDRFIAFYRARLFNAHWGEVVTFEPDNVLRVAMVFQGLTKQQAADAWKPFIDIVSSSPDRFAFTTPMTIAAVAADQFWNPAFLLQHAPSIIVADTRPGAASRDVFWRSDLRQAGQYIHGYASAWLPDSLLLQDNRERLSGAIFAATLPACSSSITASAARTGPPTASAGAREHARPSAQYASVACRSIAQSTTVSAVMLTMRRTVAEGVRMFTGFATPSRIGPSVTPAPARAPARGLLPPPALRRGRHGVN
jgi:FAD/FMN-containing dehydrogenase